MSETGQRITIARKYLASTWSTVFLDFERLMKAGNLWHDKQMNRSPGRIVYTFNGNRIEFIGMDKSDKRKGARRDYLFINELWEFSLGDWFQLSARTAKTIWCDWNPAGTSHWIDDHILNRPDCELIKSTYLDNPFLSAGERAQIESWIGKDEFYEKVYVRGERAALVGQIFGDVHLAGEIHVDAKLRGYGIDFGFSVHPACLIAVYEHDGTVILDELIYSTGLSNKQLYELAMEKEVQTNVLAIADSAEPKSISEIQGYGWYVEGAEKGPDSIRSGIECMKSLKIVITGSSVNLVKEGRNYRWKVGRDGKSVDPPKPIGAGDHAIDAARYILTALYRRVDIGVA